MRIPFPERILYSHALIFAVFLCGIQLFEHTSPGFTACSFAFILVSTAAFNIAGGMPYPSGAFIGCNALFTLILPLCVKAILGEPADSNLRTPTRSVEVYLVGMVGMVAAALVTRHFRSKRAFLVRLLPMTDLRGAYLGSTLVGIFLYFFIGIFGLQQGSIGSFALQINRFPALALLLGPIVTVRATAARRSMSPSNVMLIAAVSFVGVLGFSKEAILTPFFCWVLAAAFVGYRLRWINVLAFAVGGYLTVAYMIPYAQVGRDYENPGLSQVGLSIYLFQHMDEVRDAYKESAENFGDVHYYSQRIPLLDRLDVFAVDDALNDFTDRYGTYGYRPIAAAMENFVPHFLWPDKDSTGFGNVYARDLGFIPTSDTTTGVSFSPSADAYHEGRMVGVLLIEPLVFMLAFVILDSIFGDIRLHPVGLMMTLIMVRASNEGMLNGLIITLAQPLFAIVLAAFFCTYVLPVVSRVFAKTSWRPAGLPPPRLSSDAAPLNTL